MLRKSKPRPLSTKSATPPSSDGDARAQWRASKKAQLGVPRATPEIPAATSPETPTTGHAKAATPDQPAKAPTSAKAPRAPRAPKPATPSAPAKEPKRLSALDAAARVLAATNAPMRAKELIAAMEAQGLWKSPGGKTPEATLHAAIVREIAAKGDQARFAKHERGLYVARTHP